MRACSYSIALAEALKEVGFSTYDMPDRVWNGHVPQWNQALRTKFGDDGQLLYRPALTRKTLDELTGEYDVGLSDLGHS